MSSDILKGLLPYKWRGIEFPCKSFDVEMSQDHVEHKWPDRDGAHIESTGRNPMVFKAHVLFLNGTKNGPSETQTTPLYPDRFRAFMDACADRTSDILQHPEFGGLRAKCKSAHVHWTGERRDGVEVDVVWVEQLDPIIDALLSGSPVQGAVAQGAALDDAISAYLLRGPKSPRPIPSIARTDQALIRPPTSLRQTSFADLMNGIAGIFDQVELFQKQIAGKINEVSYRLDRLSAAVDRLRDPQSWPIRTAIERLRSTLHDINRRLLVATNPISVYIVPVDQTLSAIASTVGAPLSDILSLNVGLVSGPIVKARTPLRYHTNLK